VLEFVAIGPEPGQRWRREIPSGRPIRLGRAPANGWAVPWDVRVSREHCDLELRGDLLHVRCMESALNPAYRLGEATREFSIKAGEDFRIGATTFRVDLIEDTTAPSPRARQGGDEAAEKMAERAAPSPAPSPVAEPRRSELDALKAQVEALKAQLAADSVERRKGELPASEPLADMNVDALKSQVAAMRAKLEDAAAAAPPQPAQPQAKVEERPRVDAGRSVEVPQRRVQWSPNERPVSAGDADEAPADAPTPAAGDDRAGHLKKLDIDALKAELESQLAAKRKPSGPDQAAASIGSDSEQKFAESLKAQIDAQAESAEPPPADAPQTATKKPTLEELKAKLAAKAAAKGAVKEETDAPPHALEIPSPAEKKSAPEIQTVDRSADNEKPADVTPPPAAASGDAELSPLELIKAKLAAKKGGTPAPAAKKPATAKPAVAKKDAKPAAAKPKAKETAAAAGNLKQWIWDKLTDDARRYIRGFAAGTVPEEKVEKYKRHILYALNDVLKSRDFVASGELATVWQDERIAAEIGALPEGLGGIKKNKWSDRDVRFAGHLALQTIYSRTFPKYRRSDGPPRTIAYLSRGDIFGEIGALLDQPRSATCVTFDHPPDSKRRSAPVELVRIDRDVFKGMIESSPAFAAKVKQLIAERQLRSKKVARNVPWDTEGALTSRAEYQELGLVQGQKLLLIDLDRCTRCGDCVRACINTHDDGYTRLFLDGPRFDRFLVPSACRKCLNPACMIGCPVGSIQRGENGEILIRDWCIGCNQCADQCPYDSIQMHDVGVIPERGPGWRFLPAQAVKSEGWYRPRFRDRNWRPATAPFRWDLMFHAALDAGSASSFGAALEQPICFRHDFQVPPNKRRKDVWLRLLVICQGANVEVWMNGHAVTLEQDDKQKRRGEYEAKVPNEWIHLHKQNLIAARVHPPVSYDQTILSLRLDAVPELEEAATAELKIVTELAVVCDLCSSLPSKEPACVAQCPHDAAFRFDARAEFPRA
jgi:Fe-S-cluster-containing dehydrogenase component